MLASILLVGCSTFSRHCRTNLSAHWRKFSLAASGQSQYFVDYTKNQTSWQQTYRKDIEERLPTGKNSAGLHSRVAACETR